MIYKFFVILFYLTVPTTCEKYEGDSCTEGGVQGTCVNIKNCPSAKQGIAEGKSPQTCSFIGSEPVVCCLTNPSPQSRLGTNQDQCEPVSPELTSPKTGQKAWDKCIEYQEQFIYPCKGGTRGNNCVRSIGNRIMEGTDAAAGEFPHMALLGFGTDSSSAQFSCGGSILSDKYILTAGHCTYSRDYGELTFAVIGILKRSDITADTKIYKIKSIIKHPQYQLYLGYNDIALLETETPMQLGPHVFPACLDVGKEPSYESAVATGWGAVENWGDVSDTLLKVTLTKMSEEECAETYTPDAFLKNGYNNKTQICYGHYTSSKDTCEGDSGGPLQVQNSHVSCMYTIVGVTSFSRACGFAGQPGIYTKVKDYVPWIESIAYA